MELKMLERETGQQLDPERKRLLMIGSGAFEVLSEFAGFATELKIVKRATRPALEALGRAVDDIAKFGKTPERVARLTKAGLVVTGGSMVEGFEEIVNQVADNSASLALLPEIYEGRIGFFSGAFEAGLKGSIGGFGSMPLGSATYVYLEQPVKLRALGKELDRLSLKTLEPTDEEISEAIKKTFGAREVETLLPPIKKTFELRRAGLEIDELKRELLTLAESGVPESDPRVVSLQERINTLKAGMLGSLAPTVGKEPVPTPPVQPELPPEEKTQEVQIREDITELSELAKRFSGRSNRLELVRKMLEEKPDLTAGEVAKEFGVSIKTAKGYLSEVRKVAAEQVEVGVSPPPTETVPQQPPQPPPPPRVVQLTPEARSVLSAWFPRERSRVNLNAMLDDLKQEGLLLDEDSKRILETFQTSGSTATLDELLRTLGTSRKELGLRVPPEFTLEGPAVEKISPAPKEEERPAVLKKILTVPKTGKIVSSINPHQLVLRMERIGLLSKEDADALASEARDVPQYPAAEREFIERVFNRAGVKASDLGLGVSSLPTFSETFSKERTPLAKVTGGLAQHLLAAGVPPEDVKETVRDPSAVEVTADGYLIVQSRPYQLKERFNAVYGALSNVREFQGLEPLVVAPPLGVGGAAQSPAEEEGSLVDQVIEEEKEQVPKGLEQDDTTVVVEDEEKGGETPLAGEVEETKKVLKEALRDLEGLQKKKVEEDRRRKAEALRELVETEGIFAGLSPSVVRTILNNLSRVKITSKQVKVPPNVAIQIDDKTRSFVDTLKKLLEATQGFTLYGSSMEEILVGGLFAGTIISDYIIPMLSEYFGGTRTAEIRTILNLLWLRGDVTTAFFVLSNAGNRVVKDWATKMLADVQRLLEDDRYKETLNRPTGYYSTVEEALEAGANLSLFWREQLESSYKPGLGARAYRDHLAGLLRFGCISADEFQVLWEIPNVIEDKLLIGALPLIDFSGIGFGMSEDDSGGIFISPFYNLFHRSEPNVDRILGMSAYSLFLTKGIAKDELGPATKELSARIRNPWFRLYLFSLFPRSKELHKLVYAEQDIGAAVKVLVDLVVLELKQRIQVGGFEGRTRSLFEWVKDKIRKVFGLISRSSREFDKIVKHLADTITSGGDLVVGDVTEAEEKFHRGVGELFGFVDVSPRELSELGKRRGILPRLPRFLVTRNPLANLGLSLAFAQDPLALPKLLIAAGEESVGRKLLAKYEELLKVDEYAKALNSTIAPFFVQRYEHTTFEEALEEGFNTSALWHPHRVQARDFAQSYKPGYGAIRFRHGLALLLRIGAISPETFELMWHFPKLVSDRMLFDIAIIPPKQVGAESGYHHAAMGFLALHPLYSIDLKARWADDSVVLAHEIAHHLVVWTSSRETLESLWMTMLRELETEKGREVVEWYAPRRDVIVGLLTRARAGEMDKKVLWETGSELLADVLSWRIVGRLRRISGKDQFSQFSNIVAGTLAVLLGYVPKPRLKTVAAYAGLLKALEGREPLGQLDVVRRYVEEKGMTNIGEDLERHLDIFREVEFYIRDRVFSSVEDLLGIPRNRVSQEVSEWTSIALSSTDPTKLFEHLRRLYGRNEKLREFCDVKIQEANELLQNPEYAEALRRPYSSQTDLRGAIESGSSTFSHVLFSFQESDKELNARLFRDFLAALFRLGSISSDVFRAAWKIPDVAPSFVVPMRNVSMPIELAGPYNGILDETYHSVRPFLLADIYRGTRNQHLDFLVGLATILLKAFGGRSGVYDALVDLSKIAMSKHSHILDEIIPDKMVAVALRFTPKRRTVLVRAAANIIAGGLLRHGQAFGLTELTDKIFKEVGDTLLKVLEETAKTDPKVASLVDRLMAVVPSGEEAISSNLRRMRLLDSLGLSGLGYRSNRGEIGALLGLPAETADSLMDIMNTLLESPDPLMLLHALEKSNEQKHVRVAKLFLKDAERLLENEEYRKALVKTGRLGMFQHAMDGPNGVSFERALSLGLNTAVIWGDPLLVRVELSNQHEPGYGAIRYRDMLAALFRVGSLTPWAFELLWNLPEVLKDDLFFFLSSLVTNVSDYEFSRALAFTHMIHQTFFFRPLYITDTQAEYASDPLVLLHEISHHLTQNLHEGLEGQFNAEVIKLSRDREVSEFIKQFSEKTTSYLEKIRETKRFVIQRANISISEASAELSAFLLWDRLSALVTGVLTNKLPEEKVGPLVSSAAATVKTGLIGLLSVAPDEVRKKLKKLDAILGRIVVERNIDLRSVSNRISRARNLVRMAPSSPLNFYDFYTPPEEFQLISRAGKSKDPTELFQGRPGSIGRLHGVEKLMLDDFYRKSLTKTWSVPETPGEATDIGWVSLRAVAIGNENLGLRDFKTYHSGGGLLRFRDALAAAVRIGSISPGAFQLLWELPKFVDDEALFKVKWGFRPWHPNAHVDEEGRINLRLNLDDVDWADTILEVVDFLRAVGKSISGVDFDKVDVSKVVSSLAKSLVSSRDRFDLVDESLKAWIKETSSKDSETFNDVLERLNPSPPLNTQSKLPTPLHGYTNEELLDLAMDSEDPFALIELLWKENNRLRGEAERFIREASKLLENPEYRDVLLRRKPKQWEKRPSKLGTEELPYMTVPELLEHLSKNAPERTELKDLLESGANIALTSTPYVPWWYLNYYYKGAGRDMFRHSLAMLLRLGSISPKTFRILWRLPDYVDDLRLYRLCIDPTADFSFYRKDMNILYIPILEHFRRLDADEKAAEVILHEIGHFLWATASNEERETIAKIARKYGIKLSDFFVPQDELAALALSKILRGEIRAPDGSMLKFGRESIEKDPDAGPLFFTGESLILMSEVSSDLLEAIARQRGSRNWKEFVLGQALTKKEEKTGKRKARRLPTMAVRELYYLWLEGKISLRAGVYLPKTYKRLAKLDKDALLDELARLRLGVGAPSSLAREWAKLGDEDMLRVVLPAAGISDEGILRATSVSKLGKARFDPKGLEPEELARVNLFIYKGHREAMLKKFQRDEKRQQMAEEGSRSLVDRSKLGSIGVSALDPRRVLERLFGHGNPMVDEVYRKAEEAEDSYLKIFLDALDLARSGLVGLEKLVGQEPQEVELPSGKKVKLAPAHKIALYFYTLQDESKGAAVHGQLWGAPDIVVSLSKEDVEHVASTLTEQELKAAQVIRKVIDFLSAKLYEEAERLPQNEKLLLRYEIRRLYGKYFPIYAHGVRREGVLVPRSDMFLVHFRDVIYNRNMRKRFRSPGVVKVLEPVDAFEVLFTLIKTVASFSGRENLRLLWELVNTESEFTKKLSGSEELRVLKNWLVDLSGTSPVGRPERLSRFVAKATRTVAYPLLMFNPSSVLVQTASLLSGALIIPAKYIIRSLLAPLSPQEYRSLTKELTSLSPQIRDRFRRQITGRIITPVEEAFVDVTHKQTPIERVADAGFWMMRKMDEFVIVKLYQACLLSGMSKEEAAKKTTDAVNFTQATTTRVNAAELVRHARRQEPIPIVLTLFNNDLIKMYNLFHSELWRLQRSGGGPDDWKRFLYALAILLVALPAWILGARTIGSFAVRLPGGLASKRSIEDIARELSPFHGSTNRLVETLVETPLSYVFGPISRLVGPTLSRIVNYAATGKGAPPRSGFEDPLSGVVQWTGELATTSIQIFKDIAWLDQEMRDDPVEIKNRAIRMLSGVLRLMQLVGLPILPSRIVAGAKEKDNAYYYDMLYDSMFHSNGKPKEKPNTRLRNYALQKLSERRVNADVIRRALRERVKKELGR
ncbi:MAG: hypothetical protein QXI02_02155 [Candidatus Caldarchaeum sp.]